MYFGFVYGVLYFSIFWIQCLQELSWQEELLSCGIMGKCCPLLRNAGWHQWNPTPPSPFKNRTRAWTGQYGSWGIQPAGSPFPFPSQLRDVPHGHAWSSLGERCWCEGERRMDLLGGRERKGWRGGRISIQASQRGYKEFIKSEWNVFSLYHLLLGLWCNKYLSLESL